jgi:hypothetical protein
MPLEVALSHLDEIVQKIPEYWVYSPEGRILFEEPFQGALTAARVP